MFLLDLFDIFKIYFWLIVEDVNISSLFVCLSIDSKGATEEISESFAITQINRGRFLVTLQILQC